jgi:hypothetical protein
MPIARVMFEDDTRAAVLVRRGARWRPLARFAGEGAAERARALADVINRGLARPASELGAA